MDTLSVWSRLDAVGYGAMRLLLGALWQSSILLVAVGVLTWLLRRRRAAVRHALWVGAIVAAPLLPLIGGAVLRAGAPQAPVRILPAYTQPLSAATIEPGPPAAEHEVALQQPPDAPRRMYPWAWLLMAYAAGLLGFLGWIGMGRTRIRRWVRSAAPVLEGRVRSTFGAARETIGLGRDFLVLESDRVPAPMSYGLVHPVVLLPKGLAGRLSEVELRALAIHELAHVKRSDSLVLSAAALVRAVLFFHPLVWLACRQMSNLSELACDDAVLDTGSEPVSYAKMLTRLAEELPRRAIGTELAAGLLFSKGAFLRRVEAILSERRDRIRRLSRLALIATVVAGVISLIVACALPLGGKVPDVATGKPAEKSKAEEGPAVKSGTAGDHITLEAICAAIEANAQRIADIEVHFDFLDGQVVESADGGREFVPCLVTEGNDGSLSVVDGIYGGVNCIWKEKGGKGFLERYHAAGETGEMPKVFLRIAWDGTEGRAYTRSAPNLSGHGIISGQPNGNLRIQSGMPSQFTYHMWQAEEGTLADVFQKGAELVSTSEMIDGRRCALVLVRDHFGAKGVTERYWLDMERGFSLVRFERRDYPGKVVWVLSDIVLKEVAPNLWYPVEGISYEPRTGRAAKYHADTVMVNQGLPDSDFTLEFPPGTGVTDERNMTKYRTGRLSFGALIEGDAAAQDIFERSKAFLTALAAGDDEKAIAQTVPDTITRREVLSGFREYYRVSQASVTEVYVGPNDAAVLTSFFVPIGDAPRAAMGIGLTRHDGKWLIRDIDALPDKEAISGYVEGFLKAFPKAQRFIVGGSNAVVTHPNADVLDAKVGPVFKTRLADDTVLDLDSVTRAPRKPLWPEGFELGWDAGQTELSIKGDATVRLLLLPEAKSFGDAIEKARGRLADLKASNLVSMHGLQAQYLAVKTSKGRLVVIDVRELTPEHAELEFAREQIPVPHRDATSVGFGPVIERVVNSGRTGDEGRDFVIDFDSGRVLTPPALDSVEQRVDWARKSGVDGVGAVEMDLRGLLCMEMIVMPAQGRQWETLSVQNLQRMLEDEGHELEGAKAAMNATGKDLPATFVFRTHEGGMGILQIVGFTDNPKGVKIRYKMVQQAAGEPAEKSEAEGPPSGEAGGHAAEGKGAEGAAD